MQRAGEVIHLPVDITLDLADIPTQRRLNVQLKSKADISPRPETRTGLFVLGGLDCRAKLEPDRILSRQPELRAQVTGQRHQRGRVVHPHARARAHHQAG